MNLTPKEAQQAPHFCQDGHAPIRHWDGENEMCPLCRALARAEVEPSQWIPTSERKPDTGQRVLLWNTGGPLHHGEDWCEPATWYPEKGGFRMNCGDDDATVEGTHWMPLPSCPVNKQQDK